MKKYILITAVLSLLMLFFHTESSNGGDLQKSVTKALNELGYTSIDLKQNLRNEFEVKASINGKNEITLIVNFSMPNTVFDKEKIDELGIECFETNQTYTLNDDEEDLYATSIDSLNIGDGKISAMDLMVVEYEDFDFLEYTRAGGILGRDFLLKHHAILDYGNQVLYLKTN